MEQIYDVGGSQIRIKFMTKQIITLSDNAAARIKEIMSQDQQNSIGVRVGVKSGGCAGMSYIMEYTKEINPNDCLLYTSPSPRDCKTSRMPSSA